MKRSSNLLALLGAGLVTVLAIAGFSEAAGSAAPSNQSPPSISGKAQEGQTLTTSTGTWTNSPTSYTYQWRRCDAEGKACVTIAGATSAVRNVSSSDVGWTLRIVVAATNAAGTSYARSEPTAVVAPSPVRPPSEGPDS